MLDRLPSLKVQRRIQYPMTGCCGINAPEVGSHADSVEAPLIPRWCAACPEAFPGSDRVTWTTLLGNSICQGVQ